MPLVRINILKGWSQEEKKQISNSVHDALVTSLRKGTPEFKPQYSKTAALSSRGGGEKRFIAEE